jgi:multiple sugar transport system permease protein
MTHEQTYPAPALRRNPIPWRHAVSKVIFYLAISLLAAFVVMPFLWMISTSLKSKEGIMTVPIRWIPQHPTLEGYERVFSMTNFSFPRAVFNSFFLSVMGTLVSVLSAAMAAFIFAKVPFKGRQRVFGLFLATMMIPGTVTMVPNYIILNYLGLLDSFTGLILPSIFSAFGVFMLRQSMMGLNDAYLESAVIDGAPLYKIFYRIVLPMVKPTVATLILLNFMGQWNSYLWPLIVLQSPQKQTLQVVLGTMASMYGGNEHIQMAGAVLSVMPILVVYMFCQKYVDRGIAIGGLK